MSILHIAVSGYDTLRHKNHYPRNKNNKSKEQLQK